MAPKGPTGRVYDSTTRAQIVLLKQYTDKTNDQISAITGADPSTIKRFNRQALNRGFDRDGPLLLKHIDNEKRPEVPSKSKDPEVVKKITDHLSQTRATRSHNLVQIASQSESGLKRESVRKILKKYGYNKVKRTTKPGLNRAQRKARYQWALKFKDWTLDDWKKVIFSDETSIQVGHRRGGNKLRRKPSEKDDPTCRKNRWKGYSDFMFWGCFSYDSKGPCHIWKEETKTEKKEAQRIIDKMNKERESSCQAGWEASTAIRRINLERARKPPGPKPQWKFNKVNGFLSRDTKGGIDW
jgi:hypothetical protein